MFPDFVVLKAHLKNIIANRRAQGHVVDGLHDELNALPDSYDAFEAFSHKLAGLPMREDWPYVEPEEWDDILSECDPTRPAGPIGSITPEDAAARVEAAFLASVCGCILGKPAEVNPTLEYLRGVLEPRGEWPLRDYFSEGAPLINEWGGTHPDAPITTRENIRYVAPDDDINYTILGMLILEEYGKDFTWEQMRKIWRKHLSLAMVFGPERNILVRCAMDHLGEGIKDYKTPDQREWVQVMNQHDERCGALIRADAYGYACPGNPALAAELAWRDASFTHRKTGVYGTMFTAAAIAAAFVDKDPISVFSTALKFVPRKSRFHHIAADSLHEVSQASDWLDGYARVHGKYKEYTHCQIYQEIGTLMNSLRFAESVDDGFCKQVSQGNDADSFGATSGSLIGAFFGPGHLDSRWLVPFNDDIRTGLNLFYDRSLSALAKRMSKLPSLIGAHVEEESPRV